MTSSRRRLKVTVERVVPDEEKWPSVALAYDLGVKPSYELMMKRHEIMEGRIRALVTLAASVTFAVPVFATAARGVGTMSYTSPWLCAALSCAAFVVIAGTTVFWGSSITVTAPDLWLEAATKTQISVWEFQRAALKQAGKAFEKNNQRLNLKAWAANVIAAALLGELICMAGWIITA
jgi:hypothetical protein